MGFTAVQVGTHSIRSGSAMPIHLGECPVQTILMIEHWSSGYFKNISENRLNNPAAKSQKQCCVSNSRSTSLTWRQQSSTRISGRVITWAASRQGGILAVICLNVSKSCKYCCTSRCNNAAEMLELLIEKDLYTKGVRAQGKTLLGKFQKQYTPVQITTLLQRGKCNELNLLVSTLYVSWRVD